MVVATRGRKSWKEKLEGVKGLPKLVKLDARMGARWGASAGGVMVVPSPLEVDALMRCVPRRKVITIQEIRESLARMHGAAITCPLTTGIFAWVAAHAAAEEKKARGGNPYWRTLKTGGEVNPKFPGGAAAVSRLLRAEGHRVFKKGTRYFVADYARVLARLS
jgi:hypothetical protein